MTAVLGSWSADLKPDEETKPGQVTEIIQNFAMTIDLQ